MTGERFLVGRASDADLVLEDPKVSRHHAYLKELEDGRAALHDMGSENGIYVDDKRVKSVVLKGDERIRMGDTVIIASCEEVTADRANTIIETFPPELLAAAEAAGSHTRVGRWAALPGTRRASTFLLGALLILGAVVAAGALGGEDEGGTVADAVAAVTSSTVLVTAELGGDRAESGTGWVYDADAGLIATNAHVLNGGTSFRVGVQGELRDAEVVGVAPCEDLALLGVKDRSGLETLALGSQEELSLGETVVAVGFPGSASLQDNLTSTSGVISVVQSSFREAALDVPPLQNVVQTDAAINPGNSGGPLVNLDGELIGVNSAGRTLSTTGRIIQGQGYAIGVDRARTVLGQLRSGKSIGWVGLSLRYQTRDQLREARLPPSLQIAGAVAGTGAADAGLDRRTGWLLLDVGERGVGNSLLGYCDAVLGVKSGEELPATVMDPRTRRQQRITLRFE